MMQRELPFGIVRVFICAKCCRLRAEIPNEKEIYNRWEQLAFGRLDVNYEWSFNYAPKNNSLEYLPTPLTDEELAEIYKELNLEQPILEQK